MIFLCVANTHHHINMQKQIELCFLISDDTIENSGDDNLFAYYGEEHFPVGISVISNPCYSNMYLNI